MARRQVSEDARVLTPWRKRGQEGTPLRHALVFGGLLFVVGAIATYPAAGASKAGGSGGPRLARLKVDQAAAAKITLHLDDFPPGWKVTANWPVTAEAIGASCKRFRPDLSRQPVTGLSGRMFLQRDQAQQASSLAIVFRSPADATHVYTTDYMRYFEQCLRPNIGRTIDGLRIIRAQRLRLRAPKGGAVNAVQAVVDLGQFNGLVDEIFVLRGRTAVKLIFQSIVDDPIQRSLETLLIKRVAARSFALH